MLNAFKIKIGGRFVGNQQLGALRKCPGNQRRGFLAAAVRAMIVRRAKLRDDAELPAYRHAPGIRLLFACDELKQRGFARAVLTHHCQLVAVVQRQPF